MELILAEQSVKIKCRLSASILMGNYEYYYACGLLCGLAQKAPEEELKPARLHTFLQPLLDTFQPRSQHESYLVKMLKEYKVSGEYDEQMPKLMQMGLADTSFGKETGG